MRLRRIAARALVLGVLAAPALPSIAMTSATTGVAVRSVAAARTVASYAGLTLRAPLRGGDHLVGVSWSAGSPDVAIRWHESGGWTTWSALDADTDAPSPAERAHARPGTEPAYRPSGADAADVRVRAGRAPVTGLSVVIVGDVVRHALAGVHVAPGPAEAATGTAALGHVYSRRDWGANESMRRCGPSYARTNVAMIVHHTAQTSSYSAGDVPGMIRADYAYHVRTRGWCDLGYNLVVDRYGRIWEGRYGGVGRAVIGAHAEGFNTGTLGVAFLGESDHYAPSAAVRAAFSHVAIYAATTWHFDPSSTVVMTSGGSPRYSAGRQVRLNRVMGHRDTGETDCPGHYMYADLAGIRAAAHAYIYAPHFTSARVYGAPVHAPKPVTVRLVIDRTAHWSVRLVDSNGKTVAVRSGTGRVATVSWDGRTALRGTTVRVPVRPQQISWSATASVGWDRAHPWSGHFDVGLPSVGV
ncbi:MAG: N-acetylmuramoyl-L-alanine amidase [Actinomycetes bacterium]